MSSGWLARVFGQQAEARSPAAPKSPLPRIWAVRPVTDAPLGQPGSPVSVRATGDVRFGHLCLLVARGGQRATAIGIVLGEPPGNSRKPSGTSDALIANVFDEPVGLPAPLINQTRAAPVDDVFWSNVEACVRRSDWEFLITASRALQPDEFRGKKTNEEAAERLLVELLRNVRGVGRVERQVPLPGSFDPSNRRRDVLKIDVLGYWKVDGQRHFLVVEGKWRAIGGSQAAAQAYEYARRIKSPGDLAGGRTVFDLDVAEVQDDVVHAVVVANVVPERSDAADKLGISRLTYVTFAQLLGRGAHVDLRCIAR